MPVLLRTWLPETAARTMPGLVALVFAIAQVDAVTDWPSTLERVRDAGLLVKTGSVAMLAALGAVSAGSILRPVLYGPGGDYAWRVPLGDVRLAHTAGIAAVVATLPVTVAAGLLGPLPAVSMAICTALAAVGVVARSPWLLGPLTLAALCTGVWAPLPAAASLLFAGRLGRALRTGRPLSNRPTRSLPGMPSAIRRRLRAVLPIVALVQHDLRGLARHHGRFRMLLSAVTLFGLSWAIQRTLHRSFDPASIETGGRLLLAASGTGCGVVLGDLARIHGVRQLDRRHPVSARERLVSLLLTASLPMLPVLAGVLVGGLATGSAGTARLLVLLALFPTAAVHALVRASSQERREALASHGIATAVFGTMLFVLGPVPRLLGCVEHGLAGLLVLVLLFDTHRRLKP